MCSEDEETLYNDSKLLDPARNDVYDTYIEAYSNLLHTWRMIDKRTEVAKCLSESRNNYDKFVCNISVDCKRCGHLVRRLLVAFFLVLKIFFRPEVPAVPSATECCWSARCVGCHAAG